MLSVTEAESVRILNHENENDLFAAGMDGGAPDPAGSDGTPGQRRAEGGASVGCPEEAGAGFGMQHSVYLGIFS